MEDEEKRIPNDEQPSEEKQAEPQGKPEEKAEEKTEETSAKRKPMEPKKIVLIAVISVLAVLVVLIGGLILYTNSLLNRISRPSEEAGTMSDEDITALYGTFGTEDLEEETVVITTAPTTVPYTDGNYGTTGKVVNILLVGQDAREDEPGKNTDTMILASINKETKVITLSSFLRDSYLQLANYKSHYCGKTKLTFAYALGYVWGGDAGAMEMLDKTLINNYGVTIDGNVEINLRTFKDIINVLGGIDVEIDEDEYNYLLNDNNLNDVRRAHPEEWAQVQVGMSHMNGTIALSYARMRHATYGDNDFNRTARQRKVVAQVVEKLKGISITNLNKLVQAMLPMVVTDLSNSQIATYMMELLPILPYVTVESQQIPIAGTYSGKMIELNGMDQSVQEVWNLAPNRKIMEAVCSGQPVE